MRTREQSTVALSFLKKPFGSTSRSIGLYDLISYDLSQ